MDISFDSIWLVLFGLAILAGWIDSIAGGGGLITIPALLWAGLSPTQSLATNKLQASFGSSTATLNYARHGLVDLKGQRFAVLMTFIGSACGTLCVQYIPASYLQKALPVLLIAFAIYFLFAPNLNDQDRQQRITPQYFALSVGFGIGFYDGFFGPGTGAFFTMAYVELLGFGLPRAIGNTKLLNFTSNIASLLFFALSGQIIWLLGLLMGLGQIIGSYFGSHMAIKHGSKLIRPLLVSISVLMSVKLLWNS
jgi:hypothetical protein